MRFRRRDGRRDHFGLWSDDHHAATAPDGFCVRTVRRKFLNECIEPSREVPGIRRRLRHGVRYFNENLPRRADDKP